MRVTRSLEIPDDEIQFRFSRSGGPGGQNVNRRSTKAELLFDVTGSPSLGPRRRARILEALRSRIDSDGVLHVVAQDARTQAENRALASERFAEMLARALAPPPPPRRPTRPSRGAKEQRLQEKRIRARRKQDRTRPGADD
ncbi:MAG: aminoacyl-tRNA hydrolase [Actinobacteria bacterium]|nr:aminoacyl-tRNA hydrolase [Actinomycetota bacterium]